MRELLLARSGVVTDQCQACAREEGEARDASPRDQSGGGSGGSGGSSSSACNTTAFSKTNDSWSGSTKNVTFRFTMASGATATNCCLVNFRKGWVKRISNGAYARVRHCGATVNANFPNWTIDSVDNDPVYWSTSSSRWNYTNRGGGNYEATDAPNTPAGYQRSYDFKMCLFKCSDVPTTCSSVTASTLMGRAKSCISWSAKVTHRSNGTITRP